MRRMDWFIAMVSFTFILGMTQVYAISAEAKGRAKTAYAKVLTSDKYGDSDSNNMSSYYFAVKDLNADGIPELLIQESGIPVTTEVFTYKDGKVIQTNAPEIPAYGDLLISKERGTFSFYRGGPATTEVMPYVIIEQKLSKKKIKTVNYYSKEESMVNPGDTKFYKNGNSISESEYENTQKQFSIRINFVENSPANRKLYGVNNPANTSLHHDKNKKGFKKVKDSSYKALTRGGLNKEQVQNILLAVTRRCFDYGNSEIKEAKYKQISNAAPLEAKIIMDSFQTYDTPVETMYGYSVQWNSGHSIDDMNRAMSFCSDFRYEPNRFYGEEFLDSRVGTDAAMAYFLGGGTGNTDGCEIKSTGYNGGEMIIFYQYMDMGKNIAYKAILEKKEGKYMLKRIVRQ